MHMLGRARKGPGSPSVLPSAYASLQDLESLGIEALQGRVNICTSSFHLVYADAYKRSLIEFLPRIEKVEKQAFRKRGGRPKDAWHLGIVATDPDHEGHGQYLSYLRD